MKKLLITIATLILTGCGGGSDSNSGSGGSSLAGNYAGVWDVTFSNDTFGSFISVYTINSSGAVSVEPAPNCSGVNPSLQIVGNKITGNDSYTCTYDDGLSCKFTESGTVTFTSDTMASGSSTGMVSCSDGTSVTLTASITGTKR